MRLKALNDMQDGYAPVSYRKDCSMSFLVTFTLGRSSPSCLDVVELHTRVIRVMTLLKVEVFISEHFDEIFLTVLLMGSMWSLIEPITENPDHFLVPHVILPQFQFFKPFTCFVHVSKICDYQNFLGVEFRFDFLVRPC